jgi:hypothetical protein
VEFLRWIGTLIHRAVFKPRERTPMEQWEAFARAAAEREKAVKKQLGSSK